MTSLLPRLPKAADQRSLRARSSGRRIWALLASLLLTWGTDVVAQFGMQAVVSPTNQVWRYHAAGSGPALNWTEPLFDDSSWPKGRGLFGNELNYPYPIGTPLPAPSQGGPATVYLRTHFNWNAGSIHGVVLRGTNFVDDGCVIYLNGVEISRYNMPAGEPTYDTRAIAANPSGYPNLTGGEPVMVLTEINLSSLTNGNANPLQIGDNVLAVEVHNNIPTSSDTLFGLSLYAGIDDWFFCLQLGSPTNRTIVEGESTTFHVEHFCPSSVTFQWYRDVGFGEEPIPGATSSTYTLNDAVISRDIGIYYCRLTSPSGTVESRRAFLQIRPDDSPLFITGATMHASEKRVTLSFSKRLNPTAAQNLTNYTFTPPLEVQSVALSNEASAATLTLFIGTPGLAAYTLHIANLTDNQSGATLLSPNPTSIPLTSIETILTWSADDWQFNTNNLDGSPDWKLPSFTAGDDWQFGRGLFGGETTLATLGRLTAAIATPLVPNANPETADTRVTTYFRRQISLPAIPVGSTYVIRHFADDGLIAYLDGVEIHRFAMPSGEVSFTTRSARIPTDDATLRSFPFDASPGTHVLAVELHQADTTSDDVLFGMEVLVIHSLPPELHLQRGTSGLRFEWLSDSSWQLRSSPAPDGPFIDVEPIPQSRLGEFFVPLDPSLSHQFFRLDYIGSR